MNVADFLRQSRVMIVAGKGGVGKTTMTASLALLAARQGLDALVVELEGKAGLAACFGRTDPLAYEEGTLWEAQDGGRVRGRWLTPDQALLEYLADHGLGRVSRRLVSSGTLEVVAAAAPGIRDILILGKVKQLERSGQADLILVDAPATGHTLTFLTSAQGFLDAVRVGPIRVQASDVTELLSDPQRCQVVLVTVPEETPVNEVVETAFALEDRVGVSLGPVVVNAVYPRLEHLEARAEELVGAGVDPSEAQALVEAGRFRLARQRLQASQLRRLGEELPLAQLACPFVFSAEIGPDELDQLAVALGRAIESLPAG